MNKNFNNKRYMLIFEPKYSSTQFCIHFDKEQLQVIEIYKYKDLTLKDESVPKNTLVDIDNATAKAKNLDDLFSKYVSNFKVSSYNLHKLFIGYMNNNYMVPLRVYFDNNFLKTTVSNTVSGKIRDYDMIEEELDYISGNNGFYDFIMKEKDNNLTKETLNIMARLNSSVYYYNNAFVEYDILEEINYLRYQLGERLLRYDEFRKYYDLKNKYGEKLEADKQQLKEKIAKLRSSKNNDNDYLEEYSLFDYVAENNSNKELKKTIKGN